MAISNHTHFCTHCVYIMTLCVYYIDSPPYSVQFPPKIPILDKTLVTSILVDDFMLHKIFTTYTSSMNSSHHVGCTVISFKNGVKLQMTHKLQSPITHPILPVLGIKYGSDAIYNCPPPLISSMQ